MRAFSTRAWLTTLGLCVGLTLAPFALANTIQHSLAPSDASSSALSIGSKHIQGHTDKFFQDGLGREVSLRGFNVSGQVKLAQFGFQPFANEEDARASFTALKQKVGSNMVRYTLAWEGIQPQPNSINYAYLDDAIRYIKAAISQDLYVLLDYHSDLYSRHTFTANSKDTGNGAPKWAVHDLNGKDNCGLPCDFTWSAHKLSDSAVRNAMKTFWYDFWALDTNLPKAFIRSHDQNLCADIDGGKLKNSTKVLAWQCHGGTNQQWLYRQDGTIHAAGDQNFCLDVAGARTWNGTQIQLYQCNGTKAQQFILSHQGRLHSAMDFNKCIENRSGSLKLYDCAMTNNNQRFGLYSTNNNTDLAASLNFVQSQFVWQIGQVASYLKSQLSDYEWAHILGFEPLNEPFDGGLVMSYSDMDNHLLWPFYERVRAELNQQGITTKPVYAEPNVFWSSIVGIMAPATGGHYLNYQPGDGFVFTPHFYDQARMGVQNLSVARNAAHFENLDLIRDEARYLGLAAFVSEFGMWLDGYGHTDTERVVNATYQGLESSNRSHGKDRFVDFYTPLLSGAQWQWDYYYNNHFEYQNGNPNKLKTEKDAWNNENFSVINNYAQGYNVHAELIERAYPRAAQGRVLHFAYEGLVPDRANSVMAYHGIRNNQAGQPHTEYLRNQRFAFLAWQGRHSDYPTEIYVSRSIDPTQAVVITEAGVFRHLTTETAHSANEVIVRKDRANEHTGHVVMIWDDADAQETANSTHFALVMANDAGLGDGELEAMRQAIIGTLSQGRSPVYLTGAMTSGGYPNDN